MVQSDGQPSLAERLKALRLGHRDGRVTQVSLAAALQVSPTLISSWESGAAVPPVERLRDYALAFASVRTFGDDGPRPLDESDLTPQEERRRQNLIDELVGMRDLALRPSDAPASETGNLGGRFWYFPDGAPIRVITTSIWGSLEKTIPYADPWHPNYVQAFQDMDRDATIELVSHIRAENPASDVRFLPAHRATRDDLTKHVVILGQTTEMLVADVARPEFEAEPSVMEFLLRRLEIPVGFNLPEGGHLEFDGEFVVTCDDDGRPHWFDLGVPAKRLKHFRPRFVRWSGTREMMHGYPVLEYDVGLLARKPNELNRSTTVTMCTGIFSRGTFGAVRALTDSTLRSRNEHFLLEHFGQFDDFWMLFYVPVFRSVNGLETVTPDLGRPFHRLCDSTTGGDHADR